MGKYNIIYADPPWQYRTYSKKGQGRSAESHYPTMSIADIKALPVRSLAAKDCALFMWITFPCLQEAMEVLSAWGFEYKTVAFVWVKQNRKSDSLFWGMGYWTRANAELCILATRGHAIQQGIFTASTKQRLEELEKQKEELSLSMTTAELQKPKLTREYMEHWFSQFRYGDPNDREFQKRLIDTFVNAIFVYDDKLVLTYNYQHGTQTITLKEVEDFLGSDLVGQSPPIKNPERAICVRDFLLFQINRPNRNGQFF